LNCDKRTARGLLRHAAVPDYLSQNGISSDEMYTTICVDGPFHFGLGFAYSVPLLTKICAKKNDFYIFDSSDLDL